MEEPEPETQNGGGRETRKNVKEGVPSSSRRKLVPSVVVRVPNPTIEVKLAAIAVSLNVRLRSSDMSTTMQERAFRYARAHLDAAPNNRPNPSRIALSLKMEFDSSYGPAWHCIVGKSFGSFVTHSPGGFLNFSIDKFSLLLFKTEVRHVIDSLPRP